MAGKDMAKWAEERAERSSAEEGAAGLGSGREGSGGGDGVNSLALMWRVLRVMCLSYGRLRGGSPTSSSSTSLRSSSSSTSLSAAPDSPASLLAEVLSGTGSGTEGHPFNLSHGEGQAGAFLAALNGTPGDGASLLDLTADLPDTAAMQVGLQAEGWSSFRLLTVELVRLVTRLVNFLVMSMSSAETCFSLTPGDACFLG